MAARGEVATAGREVALAAVAMGGVRLPWPRGIRLPQPGVRLPWPRGIKYLKLGAKRSA